MAAERMYYIFMNLILPGLGQFMARRWIRGSVTILVCFGALLYFIKETFFPLFELYSGDWDRIQFNIPGILATILIVILCIIYSIVDLAVFPVKRKGDKHE